MNHLAVALGVTGPVKVKTEEKQAETCAKHTGHALVMACKACYDLLCAKCVDANLKCQIKGELDLLSITYTCVCTTKWYFESGLNLLDSENSNPFLCNIF